MLEAKLYLGHEKENCIKQSTTEIILAKKVMPAKRKKIYKHFLKNVPMQLYNVDNFLKFQKSVQKIFSKMAGNKVNLPFDAE